ncbi:hypothetical protein RUM43_009554 [Polyplax serrata]|uniref:Uncharacterized protein n=1 Tax=Polyplax serrata TaxID=468196 RepID=A0AAN8S8K6_POLSC
MGGSKEGRQQNADKKVRKVVLSEDRSGRREDKSNERQKFLEGKEHGMGEVPFFFLRKEEIKRVKEEEEEEESE